jgi:hypothetical protein
MSNDNPTFAEIAEENIRQYRRKPGDDNNEKEGIAAKDHDWNDH